MQHLIDALEKSDVKITFGIQSNQIKRIEEERERWNNIEIDMEENVDMIYNVHFWEKLGKEFAWDPFTLSLHYFEHLNDVFNINESNKELAKIQNKYQG